ncbi:MAG: hypothetical protein RLZZ262_2327 [Bacteroidota bacterium]
MWSFISVYAQLGFEHITDPDGYDHMLFLLALVAPYLWFKKKTLLWLVTAFTLGHCLTLMLAVLDIFRMDPDLVETLIPVTIAITAIMNLIGLKYEKVTRPSIKYIITTCFGLIHGLGFSTFFREMSTDNMELVSALVCFNVGLELGQILILAGIIGVSYVLHLIFKLKPHIFSVVYSSMALVLALHLLMS